MFTYVNSPCTCITLILYSYYVYNAVALPGFGAREHEVENNGNTPAGDTVL